MAIYESGEDYLETIYILSAKGGGVHAVDIANELNYSKPSITRAMKILKANGYINVDVDNHIKLTEQGREKAEAIFEKHNIIAKFWILNGVSEKNALKDACRMEHDISGETYDIIKKFVESGKGKA